MSSPDNALQKGIYDRLTGFSTLTALVSTRIFDFVPENATPPYVVIGDDTLEDDDTKSNSRWNCTLNIHCWDFEKAGRKSVKTILSAIHDALHNQQANVTVSGFSLVYLRREFQETFQDPSEEGQNDRFYHGIARYRAVVTA